MCIAKSARHCGFIPLSEYHVSRYGEDGPRF